MYGCDMHRKLNMYGAYVLRPIECEVSIGLPLLGMPDYFHDGSVHKTDLGKDFDVMDFDVMDFGVQVCS